ncbi:DNA (cytosine-5-)-methyltransferase [Mycoplasma sp. 21DD0573]|uniref:DNA (cytosine-5-)-methyltransferase n=1 Tax=Mycoplasma sp. 21DD0573 TaxID=3108525 RepID=UPI002B1D6B5D|nr:DNA (cytosine-5-)-methyltransferase [Mycoplasma sp. 21DD0573]MEA4276271.1 DNA (cytosine-5-)-methyltransferase [Mycoplasma sp. 21DD0573]
MASERERESGTDITAYNTLPKSIDIFTYSFPCQDLSQQGKQRGINENTRSGLLYEIERILKNNLDRLPKVLLLENVKALVSSKFKNDFLKWIDALETLGYKSYWKVLNAVDSGSAQNRERVFMVSILDGEDFEFIQKNEKNLMLNQIIDENAVHIDLTKLLTLYKKTPFTLTKNKINKSRLLGYTNFNSESYIYKTDHKGPTLTASGGNARLKFLLEEEKLVLINSEEAYLYMGFDKVDALKVRQTGLVHENKMIFTAGNSISVEVLEDIFTEVIKKYF